MSHATFPLEEHSIIRATFVGYRVHFGQNGKAVDVIPKDDAAGEQGCYDDVAHTVAMAHCHVECKPAQGESSGRFSPPLW